GRGTVGNEQAKRHERSPAQCGLEVFQVHGASLACPTLATGERAAGARLAKPLPPRVCRPPPVPPGHGIKAILSAPGRRRKTVHSAFPAIWRWPVIPFSPAIA